jgi:hypothetical protein
MTAGKPYSNSAQAHLAVLVVSDIDRDAPDTAQFLVRL